MQQDKSPHKAGHTTRTWLLLLATTAFGLTGYLVFRLLVPDCPLEIRIIVALLIATLCLISAAFVGRPRAYLRPPVIRFQFDNEELGESFIRLKDSESQVAQGLEESMPDYGKLWAATQDRIDYYHEIATSQARRSFISTQIATAAGFILIIVVGVIASQASSPVGAISAGAVGVVGGGLSAYIGATFLKSQAEATAQLRQFFLQPVDFSRVLGAERLIENLEKDQRAEAVQQIVRSMTSPHPAPEEKKKP